MERDVCGEPGATHSVDGCSRTPHTRKPGKYFKAGEKASGSAPIQVFSANDANFLRVKAVQERMFTQTDLTG